jgi:hypothetical protein
VKAAVLHTLATSAAPGWPKPNRPPGTRNHNGERRISSSEGNGHRIMTGDSDNRFGAFELLARRQLLVHADTPVRIGGRALAILTVLIEGAGDIVTKEKLIAATWPSTFVDLAKISAVQFIPTALAFALGLSTGGEDPLAGVIHALDWPEPSIVRSGGQGPDRHSEGVMGAKVARGGPPPFFDFSSPVRRPVAWSAPKPGTDGRAVDDANREIGRGR